MNWHRESAALRKVWYKTRIEVPCPAKNGELITGHTRYKIEMATGFLPAFKTHHKVIDGSIGYNTTRILFWTIKWGRFSVVSGIHRDGEWKVSDLRYTKSRITDQVRRIQDGVYLGMFYWRGKFLGYFWMTKVEAKKDAAESKQGRSIEAPEES